MSEKVYERLEEAETIIKKLCEKQPKALWRVRPESVAVLGITNKQRPKKSKKLASIRPVRGVDKAIMLMYNVPVRFICELFCSDWNEWSKNEKEYIMFHELMHVSDVIGKVIDHDLKEFRITIAKFGVDYLKKVNKLPSLIDDDVEFDLSLLPIDEQADEEENDEIVEPKEK